MVKIRKRKIHILNEMTEISDDKDTTMSKIIINPPHGSFIMFLIGILQFSPHAEFAKFTYFSLRMSYSVLAKVIM